MIKRISIIKYIDQAKFSVGNDLPDVKTFFELSKVNFKEVIEKLVKTQLYKEWIKSIKKEFKIEALTKRVNKANKLIKESSKFIGDDLPRFGIGKAKEHSQKRTFIGWFWNGEEQVA